MLSTIRKKRIQIHQHIISAPILLKLICIMPCVILLNVLFTEYFTKLAAQITVGYGGNIMWWHHDYIQPDKTLIHCRFFNLSKQCNTTMKIPKIIHQSYKSFDSIPHRWKYSVDLWRKHHPASGGWKYMFWNDTDIYVFMNKYYKWFLPIFNSYPNKIQRIDASRYFILYHYGGIYSDLDISPNRNIEALLSNIDIFLVETPNLGTTNSLFGSTKNSDYMSFVINHLSDYYNNNDYIGWYKYITPTHLLILFSTGPTAFWSLYGKYHAENGKDQIKILENKYFGRLSVCSPNPGIKSNSFSDINHIIDRDLLLGCEFESSYFDHVEGNSWHTESSWYINFFLHCQPVTTLFLISVLIYIPYNFHNQQFNWNKSLKWIKRNAICLCLFFLFSLTLYFWYNIQFYFEKSLCVW